MTISENGVMTTDSDDIDILILTPLKEYLMDYASEDTKIAGEKVIAKELEHIPNEKVRGIVIERLKEIADGQRDFRF